MISAEAGVELVLAAVPSFEGPLEALRQDWQEEAPGTCLELAEFGHHLGALLRRGEIADVGAGLGAVERLLVEGDKRLSNAAATCCLEALDIQTSELGLSQGSWQHLLGPKSRAYLMKWRAAR